jgi:hypothetical protein
VAEDNIKYGGSEIQALDSGTHRKTLEKASGCAIEFFGDCAHLVGTIDERKRANQYIEWSLLLHRGSRVQSKAIPISAEDLEARQDVTVVMLTSAEREALISDDCAPLEYISSMAGAFMCFREMSAQELLLSGCCGELICGGRTFHVKIVETPEDISGDFRFQLCSEAETNGESPSSIPLLIFGPDDEIMGKSGRSFAARKVKEATNPALRDAAKQMRASENREQDRGNEEWKGPSASAPPKKPKKEAAKETGRTGGGKGSDWDNWGAGGKGGSAKQSKPDDVWANWSGTVAQSETWDDWPEKSGGATKGRKQKDVSDAGDGWGNWKGAAKDDWGSSRNWQW